MSHGIHKEIQAFVSVKGADKTNNFLPTQFPGSQIVRVRFTGFKVINIDAIKDHGKFFRRDAPLHQFVFETVTQDNDLIRSLTCPSLNGLHELVFPRILPVGAMIYSSIFPERSYFIHQRDPDSVSYPKSRENGEHGGVGM